MTAADEVQIVVHSLDCFVVDVGAQMDGGKRNASQTKKKCGSLYLETVAFGSTHESEDRVQMKRIHKLMAILLVAPVCLGLSLRSGRQGSRDALVAERTDTALPVRQELVLHKHVQDWGVRCLQELLDGATPLCWVPAKKASSFIDSVIRGLGPRCCFDSGKGLQRLTIAATEATRPDSYS